MPWQAWLNCCMLLKELTLYQLFMIKDYHLSMDPCYFVLVPYWGGILFQSYLGSASDQCNCRWGKRRPFILVTAIVCICGLTFFPFTEGIANGLDEEKSRFIVLLTALTVLATTVTDFSVGGFLVPGRAYLLDVLPEEHTKFENLVCSVWISVGATTGFAIGVITWSSDFNIQIKMVCGIALIITVLWIALTLFSVDENQ